MGKLALIAVVAFTGLGAYMSLSRQAGTMGSSGELADKQYEVLARNAALVGFNRARQALADSFTDQNFSGDEDGASYEVTVDVVGTRAVVNSVGSMAGAREAEVDYSIRADFTRTLGPPPPDPPAFMDFAILAEQDITLRGDMTGAIDVTGDEASELNANLHTNSSLIVKGSSARVAGFGTYTISGTGKLSETFNPNYNPTDLTDAYQANRVEMPEVDIPTWMTNLTAGRTSPEGVSLSGEYSDGGTRDNPFIWVVEGDLNVAGNTVINGYTMFIVDGDVNLGSNLIAGESGYDGAGESSIAIYSSGNIDIGGNRQVEAQMYSGGSTIFGIGTPIVRGSITTRSEVEFRGTPDILYRPASPALTSNWVPRETLIVMTGYFER
jgi:hypothetical protein